MTTQLRAETYIDHLESRSSHVFLRQAWHKHATATLAPLPSGEFEHSAYTCRASPITSRQTVMRDFDLLLVLGISSLQ